MSEDVEVEISWRKKVALYYADKYANDVDWFIDRVNQSRPVRFLLLECFSQHIREKEMVSWYKSDEETKKDCLLRAKEWDKQENDKLIETFAKIILFMNQVFEKYYE